MRYLILLLLFCLSTLDSSAQYLSKVLDFDNQLLWEKPYSFLELENENYLITVSLTPATEMGGVGLIKISSVGEVIWEKYVDSIYINGYTNTIRLNDGSLVTSGTFAMESQDANIKFIRFNSEGDVLGEFSFGEEFFNERLYSIHKLQEGFLAFIRLPSFDGEQADACIVRFSENLEVIWTKTYEGSFNPFFALGKAHETSQGEIFVAGAEASGALYSLPVLVKINELGEELWRYNDIEVSRCGGTLWQIGEDEVVLTSCLNSGWDSIGWDWPFPTRVVKTNTETGEGLTAKNLWRDGIRSWTSMFRQDGTIVALGSGESIESDMDDGSASLECFDSDFNSLWYRFIIDKRNSGYLNNFWRALEADNGDLIFVGTGRYKLPDGIDQEDTWFVRTDSEGCLEPNCGFLQIIDEDGNYSTITATEDIVQNPSDPHSVKISPNPVERDLQVELYGEQPDLLHLHLLDSSGRIVADYTEYIERQRMQLRLPNLAAGVYFLKGVTSVGTWTKQVLVR